MFSQIPFDGIVVAIENKIILKSDVVLNMQMAGINLSQNSMQLENIYNDFLDQMINDYVLITAAEKDTNIIVDNHMVDLRLSEHMNNLINEVGSEETLISMFNQPIREIKYYYREQIYNAMLKEMYIYSYISTDISRREVELFYEAYQDSLPKKPTEYTFSIIEAPIMPEIQEVERVKNLQLSLLEAMLKIFLEEFETVPKILSRFKENFEFYNFERPHQSLLGKTLAEIYWGREVFKKAA